MKKYVFSSVVVVLLLILITVGSTYAFFSSSALTANNSVASNTARLNVIYNAGNEINGVMSVVANKEQGYNTTVKIKVAPNSPRAKSDLYIYINEITDNIAISGFIWEVYGYRNGNLVYSNSGNFAGYNSTTNNKVPIVSDYLLSEDETLFTVYFWIDGSKTGNEVVDGAFSGYIGATSQEFTGVLGSHTVTFNPNGGSVSTTSKLVQYGEAYGELPAPTRAGYRFLGWNGKNMLYTPDTNSTTVNGVTLSASSGVITLSGNNVYSSNYGITSYRIALPELVIGKQYTFSTTNISTNSYNQINYHRLNLGDAGFNLPSGRKSITFTVPDNYTEIAYWFVGIYGTTTTINHQYSVQLEEGNVATPYEPYYITNATEVVQDRDHTLTAMWEPNN